MADIRFNIVFIKDSYNLNALSLATTSKGEQSVFLCYHVVYGNSFIQFM